MTELVSFRTVLYCHAPFLGMETCCDVLCHSYVDPAVFTRSYLSTAGFGSEPEPDTLDPNALDIWPDLDPVHP